MFFLEGDGLRDHKPGRKCREGTKKKDFYSGDSGPQWSTKAQVMGRQVEMQGRVQTVSLGIYWFGGHSTMKSTCTSECQREQVKNSRGATLESSGLWDHF